MRDLVCTDKNILSINDSISGGVIKMTYRLPTTEERVAFQRACIEKKKGKVRYNPAAARIDYGLKILTGFREGDFGAEGKPISADPESKNYRKDWKDLLRQSAGDIVGALAMVVFEGISLARNAEEGDETEEDDDFSEEHEAEADGIEKTAVENSEIEDSDEGADAPLANSSGD